MRTTKPFVLCVDNRGYEASLIVGKVYRLLPDKVAARDDLVRIVDESGEDYLYHKDHFVFVDFPPAVKKKILALAGAAPPKGAGGHQKGGAERPEKLGETSRARLLANFRTKQNNKQRPKERAP